jgi:hypothetical protein
MNYKFLSWRGVQKICTWISVMCRVLLCSFFMALVGKGLLITEVSRSHSYTPHSIGLLWTCDQPDAETSTRQNTALTRDRHLCPRRDSNPQFVTSTTPSKGLRNIFKLFVFNSSGTKHTRKHTHHASELKKLRNRCCLVARVLCYRSWMCPRRTTRRQGLPRR